MDKGENGEITYELAKGHGELFKVGRKSGEVTLKQTLEGHNREYELVIRAYDGGKNFPFILTLAEYSALPGYIFISDKKSI